MNPEFLKELEFLKKKYEIIEELGYGTFSTCYLALSKETKDKVAIKAITRTTAPSRILNELKILKILNGQNYCIPLYDVIRHNDQIIAVFPLIKGIDFKEFIKIATLKDIKKYFCCLLSAVDHIHTNGLIHRDIKPSNFLYDPSSEVGFLIDFGLAQFQKSMPKQRSKMVETPILFFNSIVIPSKPPGYFEKDTRPKMKAYRAGTRGFRAPEILFKYQYQTEKLDCWSVGVILLCILTAQYPFFISSDDLDGLAEMGIIFGHKKMRNVGRLFSRIWKCNIPSITEEGVDLEVLINTLNPNNIADEEAIDFLKKLLQLDPSKRMSAYEALRHDFLK